MLALVAFESTYNMALTSVSTTSRSSYLESIPAYRELVARNEEKDSDFYRYEKLSRVTKMTVRWQAIRQRRCFLPPPTRRFRTGTTAWV